MDQLCSTQMRQKSPTILSFVCSQHFAEECFEYGPDSVENYKTSMDEHGTCVFPTTDTNQLPSEEELDTLTYT